MSLAAYSKLNEPRRTAGVQPRKAHPTSRYFRDVSHARGLPMAHPPYAPSPLFL